jgi:hypothetical protein
MATCEDRARIAQWQRAPRECPMYSGSTSRPTAPTVDQFHRSGCANANGNVVLHENFVPAVEQRVGTTLLVNRSRPYQNLHAGSTILSLVVDVFWCGQPMIPAMTVDRAPWRSMNAIISAICFYGSPWTIGRFANRASRWVQRAHWGMVLTTTPWWRGSRPGRNRRWSPSGQRPPIP